MKKVKISDYDILVTIGQGSFGRVRLIRNKATNRYSAAKIVKKIDVIRGKRIDHIQNECNMLASLSHPFIVEMQGFTQDNKHLYFITEYISGGELLTHLRSEVRFECPTATLYTAQVILIFEYLHQRNIIYRDLKPQNLLLGQDGYLKLVDFTFAKVVQTRTYTLCGTPQYLAPQILLNLGHGKGVDWWTLGVLLYEMSAGVDPFIDEDPMIIYQNILRGKIRFLKDFDKDIKSLIKHLLVADVGKRLGALKGGADDVKQHKLFSKIDFKALLFKKVPMLYKPPPRPQGDTSNFNTYPDSDTPSVAIKPHEDPFLDW